MSRNRRTMAVSVLLAMCIAFLYQSSSRLSAAPSSTTLTQARASLTKAIGFASRVPVLRRIAQPVRLAQSGSGGSSGPTVQTDKADYSPGQTVIVTGAGWLPNAVISLTFHETIVPPFHPDEILYTTTDANGNID